MSDVIVNGQTLKEGGFEVHAAYGAAGAHECAVAGLLEAEHHTCGRATELRVVPAGRHSSGRAFLGTEVVHAHLTGASGARKRVAATLAEDARSWAIALPWFEPGSHAVSVSVDGTRVGSGAYTAEAAAREVCLAASGFAGPGLDGCTAGEPAHFQITARDARGHAVPDCEAAFVVEVFAGDQRVSGDVQYEGKGLSSVTYTVTQAGPVRIAASLVGEAATRTFEAFCKPGPLALSKCSVLDHKSSITVGESALLVIRQSDRFGNDSESHLDQLRFELKANGPGPLSHWWEHGEGNTICLAYSAEHAGTYQLSIKDARAKEVLPGSPFTVAMEASVPVASHSSARFGAGVDKASVAVAGQAITVCVTLNDKYGNSTDGDGAVRVWAAGPADVEMERAGASEYIALLTAAGTYTIKATLDGHMLPDWPKRVVVVASTTGTASCRLRGNALTGITCNIQHTVSLAVYDSFDNPRTSGGDKVEAFLCGPDNALVPATITDLKSGSYTVDFTVTRAGTWTLKPRVNEEAMDAAQRTIQACYGPVSAADCQVAWTAEPVLDCGVPNKLCLYPKALEDGWKMTGHEMASMVLHTGGGIPLVQPLVFNQEGGYYEATITAIEAGVHTIYAHIDHEAVDGSPLVIDARPGAPCLATSRIDESALMSAVAGEHCSVLLTAFNEFGDAITEGGAVITATLMSHGAGSAVEVEDNGDGTYGLSFVPTEAGPFDMVVSLEKPGHAASKALRRRGFAGACAAGTTAAQCCVATSPRCQLEAGEPGTMLLRRADRFGNEVLSSIGEAPFVLAASGPSTMEHSIRDMGDGQSELSYSATVAGSYTLSVRCMNGNTLVQGTPIQVHVSAAPVSAAQSKAQLSGRAPNSLVPAGDDVEVLVTLRDAFGNTSYKLSGRQVEIQASGPELVSFSPTAPNRFGAKLTLAGSYAISVFIGNHMLPGWPLAVHVQPTACDATKCWLSGPAMQSVVCGRLSTVTLHAVDCYGNAHVSGGEEITAQLRGGPSRGIPSTIKARVVDNWDGTYALQFALPIAGEWELSASVGLSGVPCAAAASVRAEYGPLTAEDCEIENVDGVVACGTSDPIFIQAAGGRRMTGHEAVSCTVTVPDGKVHAVPVTLADGSGHFQATLHWLQVGVHKVTAYLDGRVIPSTPINVRVGPAAIHAPTCLITGLTDTPDYGMLEFEVHGRDAFGNSLELLPRMIEVWSEPAGALTDLAMAQWEEASVITVRGNVAAEGRLHVNVNGKPVVPGGHPLVAAASEMSSLAFVAEHVACRAGQPSTALLQLQDAHGNNLQAGGDVVSAALVQRNADAESLPSVAVTDRGTGLYELNFTITQAGEHTLTAQLRGSSAAAAACSVTCSAGQTSALHSRSDMSGLVQWRAGQPGILRIFRRDKHRNAVVDAAGEPPLGASLSGPGPADAVVRECAVTPEKSGDAVAAVEVVCAARTAGDYVLSVFHMETGERLFGSPFAVHLKPGAIVAAASSYRVTGSTEDTDPCMSAGQDVEIALAARDAYGNAVVDMEPSALRAAATGTAGAVRFQAVEVSNSGRQQYLRAVFTKAGVYDIAVSVTDPVTGEALQIPSHGASQRLRITPGPVDPARTQIADLPSAITAGAPVNFAITPLDAHGNPGASGGRFAAELICTAEAASEEAWPRSVECTVTETSSGTRTAIVSLQAQTTGPRRLHILLFPDASLHKENRQPEVLRESLIYVREAAASSARSFLTSFWPPQGAVAGVPAGFVIQACDEFGNARKMGGDRFKAAIRGLDGDAVAVTDRGDGSYGVQYTAPSEGTFSLAVTGADACHVSGSPATLTVFRDVSALAAAEMQRRLAAGMMGLRRGLSAARSLHSSLRSEAAALESFIPVIVEGARSGMQQALQNQETALAESRAALGRESAARRRLHNLVQELRGNIRVFVRVKPADAAGRGGTPVLACEDSHRISCTAAGSTKAFEFDRVFGPESTQEQVFGEVSQLITSALDGYNVCIFAYGQTGAGKTYTMEGTRQDPGINYRTMKELFRCIQEEREGGSTYDITASIAEIYNEQVWDLLSEGGKKEVELVKATSGAGFNVPDLAQAAVTSPEQILDIMARGFEQRATGCHDINAHSSRSHCLLIVHAATTDQATGVRTVGKLTLCDLAGSERINKTGATGLTLTEAQNINRSLLELGNVISALMQQSNHVPYRNSKLTMLLQDSLGGNAKALMIANLAPSPAHATETLSSLAFASKVSNVVLKTPQRKFEDTSADAPPAAGRTGGTGTRSGAPPRGGLPAADRPRLRAAQPAGPATASKLRTFGP
ncbi:g10168 [Coccomyxa elongata]